MVILQSPRVKADDGIDSYLSRYQVPDYGKAVTVDLVIMEWKGFIASEWIRNMVVHLWYVICYFPMKVLFPPSFREEGEKGDKSADRGTVKCTDPSRALTHGSH